MAPFTNFHRAAPSLLSAHLERSLPSNRTMASAGGIPGFSCVLGVPGVTTGGTGRLTSLAFQRFKASSLVEFSSADCARLVTSRSVAIKVTKRIVIPLWILADFNKRGRPTMHERRCRQY